MQTHTASVKRKAFAEEQTDNDDLAVETAKDLPVSKRRRRTKGGRKRAKRGGRKKNVDDGEGKATTSAYWGKLLEMPMEIFLKIFQHLKPIDLLQLSRSSQKLNCVLTSRSSKPIWSAAREAYYPELPDCPSDFSEPQYAKFVFLNECQVCSANGLTKVDCRLRTRLCCRCRRMNVLSRQALLNQIPNLTEELLECLPSEHPQFMKELFFKASAERIVKEYIKAVPPSLPPPEAEEARVEFIKSKKGLLQETGTHAEKLEKYNDAIKYHQVAVHRKLLGLGYTEEDIPPGYHEYEWSITPYIFEWDNGQFSGKWNKLVYQPRDLTPHIWEKIRRNLEHIIHNYKASRKYKRRKELKEHIYKLLADMRSGDPSPFLFAKSVYDLPTCVSLVEENGSRDSITEEKWSKVKEQVRDEIRANVEEHEQFLISSIMSLDRTQVPRGHRIPEDIDKQFLLAPSTYFVCKSCNHNEKYSGLRDSFCLFRTNHEEFVFDPVRTAMDQFRFDGEELYF